MKKKFTCAMMAAVCMVSLCMTACGNGDMDGGTVIGVDELLSVYDFDVTDCVTLGDYKNIEVSLDESKYEADEDIVMSYINSYIQDSGETTYETVDKEVLESGDVANIDYVGTIDGKEFEGGSDQGMHLELGSGSFIDGFEEGLIGHKVGENVKLKLSFPDDYWNEEYAGKKVVFKVKINEIEKKLETTFDDLTDEDVAEKYEYKDKDEMYDTLKASVEQTYAGQRASEIQNQVIASVMETSTAKVPKAFLQSELDDTIRLAKEYAKETLDMEFEDYLKQYEEVETEEEYRDKIKEELESSIEESLIIDAIMKAEKWTITEEDYEDFLDGLLDSYGMEEDEFYDQYGGKERVMLVYAENTMIEQLSSGVKITGADSKEEK